MNTDAQPGMLLAGKYRLVSLIGKGGMGSVWRAEHLDLSAPVAVKLIDPAIAEKAEALARFHREAKAAAALRSPHVVQVFDHGVDPATKTPFIVMELLDGESLAQRIARTALSWPEVADVITQVARALARAHNAGIIHRDLKPDNVFLVHNDDHDVAKVVDFGIAKAEWLAVGGASTATGTVLGTAYYMSPEQLRGTREIDHRTDLWALGVIAHECITRVHPFSAETLPELVFQICMNALPVPSSKANVPPGFDAWFEKALARNPELRFQSAKELAEALKEVCAADNPASVRHVVWASEPPQGAGAQKTLKEFEAVKRTEHMPGLAQAELIPATERAPQGTAPTAVLGPGWVPPTGAGVSTSTDTTSVSEPKPGRGGAPIWLAMLVASAMASAVGFVWFEGSESSPIEPATGVLAASVADVLARPAESTDVIATTSAVSPDSESSAVEPAVAIAAATESVAPEIARKVPNALLPGASKPTLPSDVSAPNPEATGAPQTPSPTTAPADEPAEAPPSHDSLGLPTPEAPPVEPATAEEKPDLDLDQVLDTRR